MSIQTQDVVWPDRTAASMNKRLPQLPLRRGRNGRSWDNNVKSGR